VLSPCSRRPTAHPQLALLRAPEINKTSRALAVKATGGKSITDRMGLDLQAKAARQAELKKAMEEQRLAEVTGTPEINQVGVRCILLLLLRTLASYGDVVTQPTPLPPPLSPTLPSLPLPNPIMYLGIPCALVKHMA
jgi:hypothetical protein